MKPYPCPICAGLGRTYSDTYLGDLVRRDFAECDLCDGAGVLRVPIEAIALRFEKKAALAAEEVRQVRRTLDNRREGAATGGQDNG